MRYGNPSGTAVLCCCWCRGERAESSQVSLCLAARGARCERVPGEGVSKRDGSALARRARSGPRPAAGCSWVLRCCLCCATCPFFAARRKRLRCAYARHVTFCSKKSKPREQRVPWCWDAAGRARAAPRGARGAGDVSCAPAAAARCCCCAADAPLIWCCCRCGAPRQATQPSSLLLCWVNRGTTPQRRRSTHTSLPPPHPPQAHARTHARTPVPHRSPRRTPPRRTHFAPLEPAPHLSRPAP